LNLSYDKSVDALDIRVLEDALVARTEQVDIGTLVDVDEHGAVVAIEVIHPARRWPLEEILNRFPIDDEDAEVLRSLWREPKAYPFAEPTDIGAGSDAGEVVLTG
jgi:uncharacterized protein YuzE